MNFGRPGLIEKAAKNVGWQPWLEAVPGLESPKHASL